MLSNIRLNYFNWIVCFNLAKKKDMEQDHLDNYEEIEYIETYFLSIINDEVENFYIVEINRDEELLWCNKECLSFTDAIKIQNDIDNVDFNNIGFKPFNIRVFKLFPTLEEFTGMMEYFNINLINTNDLKILKDYETTKGNRLQS